MTRSDAIAKILPGACNGTMYDDASRLIDALSALGLLKLDEPKSISHKQVEHRLDTAVRANLYSKSPYHTEAVYVPPHYILDVIERAGLKLVDDPSSLQKQMDMKAFEMRVRLGLE